MLFASVSILAQSPPNFQFASVGTPTCVQLDRSGQMHVVWFADSSYYAVFDRDGRSIVPPTVIAPSMSMAPSLALGPDRSILVWSQLEPTFNSYIRGRVYDYEDSTLSAVVGLQDPYSDAYRGYPRVSNFTDSTVLVVWSGNGPQTQLAAGIYGQFADTALRLLGTNIFLSDDTLASRDNLRPRMAINPLTKHFGIAWLRGNDWGNSVVVRWYDQAGTPLGPSIPVASDTARSYYWGHSIGILPNGDYQVAYSVVGPDSVCRIFTREFDANRLPLGPETQVNTLPAIWYSEAEIAVDTSGNSIVAWEGSGVWKRIKAQRFDKQNHTFGSELTLAPTQDTVNQYWPVIRLSNDTIYAVWNQGGGVCATILNFGVTSVSVSRTELKRDPDFDLGTYPNPFNSSTVIQFALPRGGEASLVVYDLLGRLVAVLANGFLEGGNHTLNWQAENLPSGMYLVRLKSGSQSVVQKIVLLK